MNKIKLIALLSLLTTAINASQVNSIDFNHVYFTWRFSGASAQLLGFKPADGQYFPSFYLIKRKGGDDSYSIGWFFEKDEGSRTFIVENLVAKKFDLASNNTVDSSLKF